jgi:heme/copper-type cytochrome/quinol oxidase subunit 1
MIYNLFSSAEIGVLAGNNPWRSRSPEWQIPSPAPEHSYARPIASWANRMTTVWPVRATLRWPAPGTTKIRRQSLNLSIA